MRHGRGLATFTRGFIYDGDFVHDRATGSGKAKYENGGIYDGEFNNDMRHGWGTHIFPDESIYIGEWASDKIAGCGRLTFKDGSFYEGTWEDGKRVHGTWLSGDKKTRYVGGWVDDMRHGTGTLHVEGLMEYSGQWEKDLHSGQGKCCWSDGSLYDGQWHEGRRHGQGNQENADGYKYVGEWHNGEAHGTGNARFTNGDKYTGEFRHGQPHGEGRVVTAGGDKYSGLWKEGRRHGQGRCIYANGDRFQGSWVEDRREGGGICQFADGKVFRGEWQEDSWLQSEAEPALCKVAGLALAQATAGEPATFTITAIDCEGNIRLSEGDNFLVWLEGPSVVHAEVVGKGSSTYTATYTAMTAGMYQLYITNDTGEAVAESPYPLRIVAAKPCPRKSIICLDAPGTAIVTQPVKFEIVAKDAFDNRCYQASQLKHLPLEIEVSNGPATCHVECAPGPGGSFACSFTPRQPGYYRLTATSQGLSLGNSPVSISVKDGREQGESSTSDERLVDRVTEWEQRAAEQYKEDGQSEGWSTDESEPETAEQKYIKEHPDVPVVENLRDMWKVTKLQQERKAKQEAAQAQEELQELKSAPKNSNESPTMVEGSAQEKATADLSSEEKDPGGLAEALADASL